MSFDSLVLHPLGGTCCYLNLHVHRQFDSNKRIVRELTFVFEFINSPKFIKIGSGIHEDCQELTRQFGLAALAGRNHVIDALRLFFENV